MRSFSCLTIRARDGAPLFRVGEIFRCHSGGYSQSLVRDTVKIPVPIQCVFPIERSFIAIWTWHRESCLTSLQPEIAQSWMLIRTPAERPMIFSLRFFILQIVNADAAPHQTMLIKLPILVAIRTKPMPGIIVPFVGEPHRNAISIVRIAQSSLISR